MKYMSAFFYSSVCSNLNQSQNLKFNHTQDRSKTRKVESKFFFEIAKRMFIHVSFFTICTYDLNSKKVGSISRTQSD